MTREAASVDVSAEPATGLQGVIDAVEAMGCNGNHKVGYCPVVLVDKREIVRLLRAALTGSTGPRHDPTDDAQWERRR